MLQQKLPSWRTLIAVFSLAFFGALLYTSDTVKVTTVLQYNADHQLRLDLPRSISEDQDYGPIKSGNYHSRVELVANYYYYRQTSDIMRCTETEVSLLVMINTKIHNNSCFDT